MTSSYFDHPSEEALERFLLQHCQNDELDTVETHIMACDGCVGRLEELELQMAAVKLALSEHARNLNTAPARHSLRDWLTVRNLSWAGAVAALALTVSLTPHFVSQPAPAADINLIANRGTGVITAPQGRPLHLHLGTQAIANGPIHVVMVDGDGAELWNGTAQVRSGHVDVNVPKVTSPGTHYVRLYSLKGGNAAADLLREFPFNVN